MNRISVGLIICFTILGLTACGRAKGANFLTREAELEHGSATVVSKVKDPDGTTTVVLHDTLQDFDYSVTSTMDPIIMDGEEFGSLPGTWDDFQASLIDKIIADEQTDIENIEKVYGASFSTDMGLSVYADDPDSAKQAACEIATIFQDNNLKHRLDDMTIIAMSNDSYFYDRTGFYDSTGFYDNNEEMVGYITLPDLVWKGRDQELIEEYTIKAKEMDPDAEFIRTEIMSFEDTGYDLDDVTLTGDAPRRMEAPVTLYYFSASDGRVFYIADFCINDANRPSEFYNANNY